MADANTSLPIRTQNPGDVIAKLSDATTPSQQLAISSAGAASVTTLALGAPSGGTAGTASDLVGGIYNLTPLTLVTGQQASLQLDAEANLKVVLSAGSATIGAVTQGTIPWVDNIAQFGGTAVSLGQKLMAASIPVTIASDESNLNVTVATALPAGSNSIGTVNVSNLPTTVDTNNGATGASTVRVAANLAVAGANVSITNPVPVTITTFEPGTPVQDYHTSAALAAGSSVTFTYTVAAAHTFNLERAWASASGKIKAVLLNNAATIMVGFNSTASPNIDMTIIAPPTVAAGNTVQITITNDDILPFDVYATIEGNQN